MEALTAASVACLTIYDMCKAVDRGMEIGPIRLLHKEGGKSGTWIDSKSNKILQLRYTNLKKSLRDSLNTIPERHVDKRALYKT